MLKPLGSRSCGRPGRSRSSQARLPVPRLRPVRVPETSRDRWLALWGLAPGSAQVTLSFPSRESVNSPFGPRLDGLRILSRGWREGAHTWSAGAGSRAVEAGGGRVPWADSSLPGRPSPLFPPPLFPPPLLPQPRRRPSSLAARRPTRSPEVGNCRPSALYPDGTLARSRPRPFMTSCRSQTLAPRWSRCARGHAGREVRTGSETVA